MNCSYSSVQPRVAVLMATYNGQAFLEKQLSSIHSQDYPFIDLWVSDDGSQDATLSILKDFQSSWTKGTFHITSGPGRGFAANFMSLIASSIIEASYYAYADQDDLWQPEKLSKALGFLSQVSPHVPALYCSRTVVINEQDQAYGLSPLFKKLPSFSNALVQNIATGNTMVINNATRQLLKKAGFKDLVISHDWLTYLFVSACDGVVFYDPYPNVLYRQHHRNVIGFDNSIPARIKRFTSSLKGYYTKDIESNIHHLQKINSFMTDHTRSTLSLFLEAQSKDRFSRLTNLYRSGVYKQTLLGNIALFITTFLKKN